jgi:ornithine--oxo-acid transaminase
MQAIIISCCGCFHGRTLAAISMSCDNEATRGFGPLLSGHLKVDFGDVVSLEKSFRGLNGPKVVFLVLFGSK